MKNQSKQPTVGLMIRTKVDGKWRRFKAVTGKRGRVIPGLVAREGREIQCSDVSYELRFYKDGTPHYMPAGKNAMDAEAQRRSLATRLNAKLIAKSVGADIELDTDRKSIKAWASTYVAELSVLVGGAQVSQAKYAIGLFLDSCKEKFVDQLRRANLISFLGDLEKLPLYRNQRTKPSQRRLAVSTRNRHPVKQATISARTIAAYYHKTKKWLLEGGADPKIFPSSPKFEEPEITIYSPSQIKSLLAIVKGNRRMALMLMLMCGLRRKEVAFAYFSDVNFESKTILVRGKPERGFKVKTRVQRYVPVPDVLLDELRQWEADHPGQQLIIQTVNGFPELSLNRQLKRFVYQHGLRCGRCDHCRSGNPNCEEWELHKFRRTYLTGIVRHVDLRTAQQYAGHSRITSTERYLRSASAAEGQSRVSSIDWTVPFYT